MLFLKITIPVLIVISVLASNVAGLDCIVGLFRDSNCSGNVVQDCGSPARKSWENALDYAKSQRANQICTKRIKDGQISDLIRDENGGYYYNSYVGGNSKLNRILFGKLFHKQPVPKKCEDGSLGDSFRGCKIKVPVAVPANPGPEDLRGCKTEDSFEKIGRCRPSDKDEGLYIRAWQTY